MKTIEIKNPKEVLFKFFASYGAGERCYFLTEISDSKITGWVLDEGLDNARIEFYSNFILEDLDIEYFTGISVDRPGPEKIRFYENFIEFNYEESHYANGNRDYRKDMFISMFNPSN